MLSITRLCSTDYLFFAVYAVVCCYMNVLLYIYKVQLQINISLSLSSPD